MQTAGRIAGEIDDRGRRAAQRRPDARRSHVRRRRAEFRDGSRWRARCIGASDAAAKGDDDPPRCAGAAARSSDSRWARASCSSPAAADSSGCCSRRAFRCSTARWRSGELPRFATPACRPSRSWSMRRCEPIDVQAAVPGLRLARVRRPRRRHDLQAAHARRRHHARHDAARAGVRRQRDASAICGWSSRSAMAALLLQHRARQSGPGADDRRVLVRAHHRPAVRARSTACSCSTGRRSRSTRGSTRRRTIARGIASVSARSRTSAASAAAAPA